MTIAVSLFIIVAGPSRKDAKASRGIYNDHMSTHHNFHNTRDREGSRISSPNFDGILPPGRGKGKLSKRDSVFFKPSEKDNKVLVDLVLKVSTIITNRTYQ